ncbi:PQQ-dependent sugar dehydrogenase [Phytoactinopolyspora mesophila]|uniref:Carbohydrate-binding protein n=1 Tax=Phytoactinopolyspora mesophila TaxID=2650750 RepID=A0A7K3M867_9ACTN|nr:PQQ-dependent sugar dehydrogenase [Phytoactinopolyspora mesophila]NDL59531.1 carbohydrate-binding protein [Phytoactinopolyspora mesophila]
MMSISTRIAAVISAIAVAAAGLAGVAPAGAHDHPDTDWEDYEKITLTSEVGEPMSMAVLPDRRVLHTNRQGQFRLYDPQTASTRVITSLPVYQFSEDGMQGIALDPDFEDNGWVYVYYSPVIPGFPEGPAPNEVEPGGDTSIFDDYVGHNVLSRFQFVDDPVNPYIDLDSEQEILEVPINRGLCCHNGGDIGFDSQGNLFLSTGDDTNPFQSQNYTPIDVRPYRNPGFDAQRTSANTADLRGKLLRITVNEDGSYDVPDDNMFTSGEWDHLFPDGVYDPELARPEIYAMGFRNPFRFSVDPVTDAVYLGDYGPDASAPNPDRGPRATIEWVVITEPRNHGWPYCVGNKFPYVDYDFETGESGDTFDCDAPVNESPLNTGLEQLPPMTPAEVWYHNSTVVPEFPELGSGGGGPMGGPAYQYDADVAEQFPTAFPVEFDGVPLFYEWTRNYIKQFHLDDDGTAVHEITDMLPDMDWNAPMDMEWGPDGSLYVLEYGGGFFVEHPLAQLSRVDYVADGRSPRARVTPSVRSGQAPLEVAFSSEGTEHPDEDVEIAEYHWNFGDGATSTETHPTHTFTENGVYPVTLTVTDTNGLTGQAGTTIVVGNTAPEVDLALPVDGGFFDWGEGGGYRIDVTDVEDGDINCDEVILNSALGHDEHAHPMGEQRGCEGTFDTPADSGHGPDLNVYWVLTARYTDRGAEGLPTLTGTDQVTLQPKRKQAQFYDAAEGVSTQNAQDPEESGGQRLSDVNHGDWVAFEPVHLLNIDEIEFRVRSEGAGGTIELRRDAPDGELLGAAEVTNTGGDWEFVSTEVNDPGTTFTAYLVFTNPDADADAELFNLNFFDAIGEGVAGPPPSQVCEGTIVLGVADSGVEDRDAGTGTCVSELLDDGREWRNRGEFVSHVDGVTRDLLADAVITSNERALLVRAAARSGIGGRS